MRSLLRTLQQLVAARPTPRLGGAARAPRVLILVENLPVPLDRRVWLECLALRRAGYGVSVICPRADGAPRHQVIEGVHIHGFPPAPASGGLASYLLEFANGLVWTALLSLRVLVREGFDVLQTCNPPDTMFVLARLYRMLGKKFVYDQHDLCPEVFASRFARRDRVSRAVTRGLLFLERATYASADHVIVTNGSYREKALGRGRCRPESVSVVRSGPDARLMRRGAGDPALRAGRAHLACYLGVMGPQDGVDLLLEAVEHYVHALGRRDCQFALLGFGDCLPQLRERTSALALDDFVSFPGRADDAMITKYLSTADVGLSPDPRNPLNDISTMNKTLEYMAFGLPVLAYDLKETRVSAGEAAEYVRPNDHRAYAAALAGLLDDPLRRRRMGVTGRQRIEAGLSWNHQSAVYLGVFDGLVGAARPVPQGAPAVIELTQRDGARMRPPPPRQPAGKRHAVDA